MVRFASSFCFHVATQYLISSLYEYWSVLCCFTAGRSVPAGMIRNLAIQLRKVCNHPDLLESAFDDSCKYHTIEWLYWFHDPLIWTKICCFLYRFVSSFGRDSWTMWKIPFAWSIAATFIFKESQSMLCSTLPLSFHFLLLLSCYLHAVAFANCYQVLIFSQWTKVLDIMDYYFSEKGFAVCRIDGSVKLEERKQQVCTHAWITQSDNSSYFFDIFFSSFLVIVFYFRPWIFDIA